MEPKFQYTCFYCGLTGDRSSFGKYLKLKGNVTCDSCRIKRVNEDRRKKNENLDESDKEIIRARNKSYYNRNRELLLAQKAKYYEAHKDELLAEMKNYQLTNKESIANNRSTYYIVNKETIREKTRIYRLNRRMTDSKYKMKQLIKSRLWGALKNYSTNGKTMACKEYGIDFDSIFSKIGPRPSSEHELDHIIPITMFNLDIPEHVRLAHLPCNLRWITKKENISKSNKIPEIAYYYPPLWEILVEIGIIA